VTEAALAGKSAKAGRAALKQMGAST